MKRRIPAISAVAALVLGLAVIDTGLPASAVPTSFYVSPTGSDSSPGTLAAPFLTITKCASVAVAGDTCLIRGGTYRETVTVPNSGTSTAPITFRAYLGEQVIVSGADAVTASWAVHSGSIYRASVALPVSAPSSTGLFANQVFVDGSMVNEARWPNAGSNLIQGQVLATAGAGSNVTTLVDSTIPAISGGWTGGTAYFLNTFGYIAESGAITADSGSGTLTVDSSTQDVTHCSFNCLGQNSRYFLYGRLAALDTPGEWFYDAAAGYLYLWSPDGAAPHGVEYKSRSLAFDLSGRSHVTLQGLGIHASTIQTSASSSNIVLDALAVRYLSHFMTVPFDGAKPNGGIYEFAHQTDTGIMLNGTNNVLKNSVLQDSAGNGVTLSGSGHVVQNNLFDRMDYGMLYTAAIHAGATSTGLTITANTIRNTARDGINVNVNTAGTQSWTGNTVSFNDVSFYGQLNKDVAGIYLCCSLDLSGTSIANNWVHDGQVNLSSGIYLDAGSGNAVVSRNVTWRNSSRGVYFNTYNSQQGTGTNYANNRLYNNTLNDGLTTNNGAGDFATNNIFAILSGSPTSTTNIAPGTNPIYVGSGVADYRISAASPAVNSGTTIAGITDGAVGAPDIGAYERGASDFIPGCSLPGCTRSLVTNGDFETGLTASWCNDAGSPCAGASITTSSPGAGVSSVQLAGATGRIEQYLTGLAPSTTYILSSSGRVATANEQLRLGIRDFGGPDTYGTVSATSWTSASLTFTTGPASTTARVYAAKATGAGNSFADAFVVRPAPAPRATFVANGNFESGALPGWCDEPAEYCASASVTAGAARSGGFGVQVGGSGSDAEQRLLGLEPATAYRLTAYARVSTAGQELRVGVKSYGGAELYQSVTSTSWTPVTVDFVTGAVDRSARLFVYKNTGGTTAFADDIRVQALGDATSTLVGNSSFDTGSYAPWCNTGSFCAGNALSTAGSLDTGYSAQVTGAGADTEQVISGLLPSTTYTITAQARSVNGQQLWVGVKNHGGAETTVVVNGSTVQQVQLSFTTGASSTSAKLYLWKNTGAGTATIDDVYVTPWSSPGRIR